MLGALLLKWRGISPPWKGLVSWIPVCLRSAGLQQQRPTPCRPQPGSTVSGPGRLSKAAPSAPAALPSFLVVCGCFGGLWWP